MKRFWKYYEAKFPRMPNFVGFSQPITLSKQCWWINCAYLRTTVNVIYCRTVFIH